VEDGPDRWAPPVGRRKREGEERWAGGRFRGPEAERAAERKGERGKNSPALGWAERRRERKRGFCYFFSFFILKTHKLKQKHATTNDAQALG
jgi:hypothetical protein